MFSTKQLSGVQARTRAAILAATGFCAGCEPDGHSAAPLLGVEDAVMRLNPAGTNLVEIWSKRP